MIFFAWPTCEYQQAVELMIHRSGWEKNTNLSELTSEKAKDTINDKMRKDLKAAFELAIEQHPVEYYKDILKSFQEELIAQEEARKEAAATPKKGKKSKAKAADDEDTEMADGDASVSASAKKSKKRKAEDETSVSVCMLKHSSFSDRLLTNVTLQTPQRSDSVKKPKIKLNTSSTPKTANGAGTPKSAGAGSAAKAANVKPKKAKEAAEKKADTPKEPKMSPEERHKRKEVSGRASCSIYCALRVITKRSTNDPHRRRFYTCATSSSVAS